jgi:hypothetical protein
VTRDITAGVATEVAKSRLRMAMLAELVFDTDPLYVWSGLGSLVWDGRTYLGTGSLGRISQIEETSDVRSNGIQLSLSGIPSALISIALGTQYQGRPCRVRMAFFDASNVLIDDPVQVFSGSLDVMQVVDSGTTCEILVTAENRLIDLERPSEVRYYADADQQRYSTGDLGCQFVEKLQTKEIVWGRVRSSPAPVTQPSAPATSPSLPTATNNAVADPGSFDTPDGLGDGGGDDGGDNGTGGFGAFTV